MPRKCKLYYYESSLMWKYGGRHTEEIRKYLDKIKNTDEKIIYVTEENKEIRLKVIGTDDNCNLCYFMDEGKPACPTYCSHINYIKIDECSTSSNISIAYSLNHLKNKLCNPDICQYIEDCDNAPFCMLDYLTDNNEER